MQVTHTPITHIVLGYNIYDTKTPFVFNHSVTYFVQDEKEDFQFTIPVGFRSDGTTFVFQIVRLFLGCDHKPEYLNGAFGHDYMCRHKDRFKRKTASRLLRQCLLDRGVDPMRANIMYFFVEIFQISKGWK